MVPAWQSPGTAQIEQYFRGISLQIEYAELSLIGGREENQDRVLVVADDGAALVIVIDGMGGHADGAKAAEVASQTIGQAFEQLPHPVFDPQGFLHLAIGQAHQDLVALGSGLSVEVRPRATCVTCLIQDGGAYWGHVGDSRIYLIRNQQVHERTRDHSHVELLLQEGLITEEEIIDHPMRNFVECCLGGDITLPGMNITSHKKLLPGDTLLACTDGFWSGLTDEDIGRVGNSNGQLTEELRMLGEQAVKTSGQYADNTSAVALRWMG
jgi:serine/threonine protein phosphatase PrpC